MLAQLNTANNGAIGRVLAPLLSCVRHNTTTDGGLNTVKHDSNGIMAPSHADKHWVRAGNSNTAVYW